MPRPRGTPGFTPSKGASVDLGILSDAAKWLGIGTDGQPNRFSDWNPRWTPEIVSAVSGHWDGGGLTRARADNFRVDLIVQICLAGCFRDVKVDADALNEALRSLAHLSKGMGEAKAGAALIKAANKCCPEMFESLGPWSRTCSDPSVAPMVIKALAKAGGKPVALQIGKRLVLSRNYFTIDASRWVSQQAFADVYAEVLAQGAGLAEIWNLSAKPGQSLAGQAAVIIGKMAEGPIKANFRSWSESKEVGLSLSGAAAKGSDAWLAKGLNNEHSGMLANIVDRLDELHPGQGAQMALAWLMEHPEIKQEFEAKGPASSATRKASRL